MSMMAYRSSKLVVVHIGYDAQPIRCRPLIASTLLKHCVFAGLLTAAVSVLAAGLVPPTMSEGTDPPPPWRVVGLPMQQKPFTRFSIVDVGAQRVLRLDADHSYGNLVHPLTDGLAWHYLSWRWRVDVPNDRANLRLSSGDDSAAEICVLFDMPMDAVPFVDRQIVRAARVQSPVLLPTATVCYVWDAHLPMGTELDNAFTRRVRMIVVRGRDTPLRTWTAERRDIRADFLRLFSDEASEVPPIIGISVAADADNTQTRTLSFVADLSLEP